MITIERDMAQTYKSLGSRNYRRSLCPTAGSLHTTIPTNPLVYLSLALNVEHQTANGAASIPQTLITASVCYIGDGTNLLQVSGR